MCELFEAAELWLRVIIYLGEMNIRGIMKPCLLNCVVSFYKSIDSVRLPYRIREASKA